MIQEPPIHEYRTTHLLRDFLNSALRELMSMVNAECGSLFLFDSDKKELVLDSFLNSCHLPLNGLKLKLGEGVSGKVGGMNSPVLVKDIEHDLRFKSNGYKHYHTKSFMSLPLAGTQGLVGVINLADKANGKSFTQDDLKKTTLLMRYIYRIAQDIMRIHTLEHTITALNRHNALAEKYAAIGKIASGVLHEINSPLDGILRYANMLLSQFDHDSVNRTYMLNIKKGLLRITDIIRSVLEFSHYCQGTSQAESRTVNIHDMIDDSLDMLKSRIKPGITITRSFDARVCQIVDFGIQHVFLNLINNALDAMPAGGQLCIETRRKEGCIEITFSDTGHGISEEILPRIFEPFFTTKEVGKGTGLGLAMSKEISLRYGGTITVRSSPGTGSVFCLNIPQEHTR